MQIFMGKKKSATKIFRLRRTLQPFRVQVSGKYLQHQFISLPIQIQKMFCGFEWENKKGSFSKAVFFNNQ